ncbi:hypothetical protein ACFQS7_06235 [Dankookia sp. GCM10030260]|uniref:hypothetical protein n=1 Tax=Dankookia sp. GCM10030260 TaxID=3273390 RepID=UPI0036179D5B
MSWTMAGAAEAGEGLRVPDAFEQSDEGGIGQMLPGEGAVRVVRHDGVAGAV